MKTFYVKAIGIPELESWSYLLYKKGYNYIIEGELFENVMLFAIKVDAPNDVNFEKLKLEFKAINDIKVIKY